jgi:hypothetical protein
MRFARKTRSGTVLASTVLASSVLASKGPIIIGLAMVLTKAFYIAVQQETGITSSAGNPMPRAGSRTAP